MTKSIHVNIEKSETWEQFKAFVENKHGKTHTVMGQELEKAILLYLDHQVKPQGSTHTHEHRDTSTKPPVEKKTRQKSNLAGFETVKETFFNNAADTDSFQKAYAERLIKENMQVYDPRTIEKYCSEIESYWEINHIS